MKKILSILSVLLFGFVLVACGDDAPDTEPNEPEVADVDEGGEVDRLQGGQNERLPLEIIETGYGFASWNEDSLSYGIVLYNPNDEALEFPSFRVTARREDDTIIGTDDSTLMIIYPGQTLTIANISSFNVIQDEVYSVEFETLEPSEWGWGAGEFIEFETINTSLQVAERDGYSVTGEISNPNDRAFDSLRLDMIIRDADGNIVGGDSTFIDGVSANGSIPFQMDVRSSLLENVNGEWEVEVHASPW